MTQQSIFIEDTTLAELGRGAGLTAWSFRACAQGKSGCPCVRKGYEAMFGARGLHLLECMALFAHWVGRFGHRKIGLAAAGHVHITRDEASILAAISAAQLGDVEARDAHLAWLLASPASLSLKRTIDEIAYGFAEHNVVVVSPEYQQPNTQSTPTLRLVSA
jgi:hypothetical protein